MRPLSVSYLSRHSYIPVHPRGRSIKRAERNGVRSCIDALSEIIEDKPHFRMNTPFQTAVRKTFIFLEQRGFKVVAEGPAVCRYESTKAIVGVDRDHRSGEMNVWFGLRAKDGAKEANFSLTDLLAMERVASPLATKPYEVYSDEEIGPFVEDMAKSTEIYAGHALEGDEAYFRKLSAFRVTRGKEGKLP